MRNSAIRTVALAALAGIIAGGIALYVKGGVSGNNGAGQIADAAGEAACAAKSALAGKIGDGAAGEVAAMLAADPPQSLGGLSFRDPSGAPVTLSALAGRVLLVNLWATWCAPCRHEMPALDALQRRMGGDGFEVVAVNVDTGGDDKPRAFLREIGIDSLKFYRDPTLGLFNELKRRNLALGLPVTLLVDRDGCLMAHMNGPAEWASDDAVRLVESAM